MLFNKASSHYFYCMKTAFLVVLLITFQLANSQSPVKVYFEKQNGVTVIYADNNMLCPLSLKLKLDKTNMNCKEECPEVVVLPGKAAKHPIVTLLPEEGKSSKFSYNYKWFYGNITKNDFDKNHAYYLPFEEGKEYTMAQGYNGPQSHRNVNALDFTMPEGSNITAAREGVVVKVVQSNWNTCPEEKCKEFNNTVTIYHKDGTFAEYAHIKQNGAIVKEGDVVKAGQLIAKSGNTGWSSGPHLHFLVYKYTENGMQSLETKFKVGNAVQFLKVGERYTRVYD